MSPWKGRVYGSRWRGRRVTWKFSSPFCQHSMITISVPEHFPEDWISAVWLIWAPLRLGGQGSHLVSVGACLCLWRPKTALAPPPLSSWGLREGVQVIFILIALLVSQKGAGNLYLSLHSVGKGSDTDTVYVSLWSSRWETGTFILKGQKHF